MIYLDGIVTNIRREARQTYFTLTAEATDVRLTLNADVPSVLFDSAILEGDLIVFAIPESEGESGYIAKELTVKLMKGRMKQDWDYTCASCGKQFAPKDLTMGHMLPKSKGGGIKGNIAAVCQPCNDRDKDKIVVYTRHTPTKTVGPSNAGLERI